MSTQIGATFGLDRLLAIIHREVVRVVQWYHKPPRVGLVVSYDKNRHAVKVQFQPEGTLSGWIPLTAVAVGNGFGIVAAPNIMDQVEVHFQEGDHLVARVMTRHFSADADNPPQVNAGEYHIIHGSGAVIRMTSDGTLFIGGSNTITTGNIGGGQSGDLTTGSQGQVANPTMQGTQQQPSKPQAQQAIIMNPDGSLTISVPNGSPSPAPSNPLISITSSSDFDATSENGNVNTTSQNGNVNITASNGNISITAGSGTNSITLTAPTIILNGEAILNGSVIHGGPS